METLTSNTATPQEPQGDGCMARLVRDLLILWRGKAETLESQADAMGPQYETLPGMWRIVAGTLRDCANDLESMSGPQGSRKTSVDDDRARLFVARAVRICDGCRRSHWQEHSNVRPIMPNAAGHPTATPNPNEANQ